MSVSQKHSDFKMAELKGYKLRETLDAEATQAEKEKRCPLAACQGVWCARGNKQYTDFGLSGF